MQAYGGYIVATDKNYKRITYPVAFIATSRGDAELTARATAYEEFPVKYGFGNHGWGVVAIENAAVTSVVDADKEETCS